MQFAIEKNIPAPPPKKVQRDEWNELFASMKVGDSVVMTRQQVDQARMRFKRWQAKSTSRSGLRITRQQLGKDEFRLWLIEAN
jgi:hypothetical protein